MQLWPKGGAADQNNKRWRERYPVMVLYRAAKTRATRAGLAFNITPDDIVIPKVCPYLKVSFQKKSMYAPSLDRIDPKKGYVKGNVEVISRKANLMKGNATVQELLEFAYEILERY